MFGGRDDPGASVRARRLWCSPPPPRLKDAVRVGAVRGLTVHRGAILASLSRLGQLSLNSHFSVGVTYGTKCQPLVDAAFGSGRLGGCVVVASLFLRCSALLGLSSSRPRLGRSCAAALWRLRPQLCLTELSRLRLPNSPRKPTLSRRAASLARCAPIPTCTDHPLTLDPLMMGLSGGGEGCTSLARDTWP